MFARFSVFCQFLRELLLGAALKSGKPHGRACCADLNLDPPERTESQKLATRRARGATTPHQTLNAAILAV